MNDLNNIKTEELEQQLLQLYKDIGHLETIKTNKTVEAININLVLAERANKKDES